MHYLEHGDLAEGLELSELRFLVLSFRKVDWNQLVGDTFLLQDSRNATGAGRHRGSVELDSHVVVRWYCRKGQTTKILDTREDRI